MNSIEKESAAQSTASNEAEVKSKGKQAKPQVEAKSEVEAKPQMHVRRMAGIEVDIETMIKALNDAKSLGGDLQQMAEKANLGRSIETIGGGKVKVPTPAVLGDLLALGLLGADKAKAKTKCDKVKSLLSVLRGLEGLGVIKR